VNIKIEAHPVIPAPSWEDMQAYAAVHGVPIGEAAEFLVEQRRKIIDNENDDPFRYGFEPPAWHAADALLGLPCWDARFADAVRQRFGMEWKDFIVAFREKLGIYCKITTLLIMGANRSSKSEFTAKRGVQILADQPGASVHWFHMSAPRSKLEQQPLIHKYFPYELRGRQVASATEYIKFKQKTGFSEDSFILPNMSAGGFRNYSQDMSTALEGLNDNAAFPDELVPVEWLESLEYRVATRAGIVVPSFTPVKGYSPSVKRICDSMDIRLRSIGYCLPKDGGPPDVARALGLTEDQLKILQDCEAQTPPLVPPVPRSIPEDLFAVMEDKSGQIAPPAGREFELVPRIAKGFKPGTAVIWFHGADNPYGNPLEVIRRTIDTRAGTAEMRIRVYGIADKAQGAILAKYSENVHVIDDAAIPKDGTNYYFVDPHGERNFFMGWIRATRDRNYTYREWPGNYHIPGKGVPEPWAIPSGRNNGVNDGAKGKGQDSFGFGLIRIKYEIARLERWEDFLRWQFDHPHEEVPMLDDIALWDERHGAEEVVYVRYMDSRAASGSHVKDAAPMTLQQECAEIGLEFELTPGTSVDGGLEAFKKALDYVETREVDYTNTPRHLIAKSCINSRFACENYQGADGQDGACKDPIDIHRYFYEAGCVYAGPAAERARQAGTRPGRKPGEEQFVKRQQQRASGQHPVIGRRARTIMRRCR
jgi:hypothetical protein